MAKRSLIALTALIASTSIGVADDRRDCANVVEEQQAIEACSRLLKRGGASRIERATFLSNRGAAHLNAGDFDLALRDLNRSISLDERSAPARYNRGVVYFFQDEHERAISDLSKALRLRPAHANSHLYRGRAHLALDQHAEAIRDFTRGLNLDPDNADFYLYRGNAYYVRADYNSAIADYSQALRMRPNSAVLLNNRAYSYFKLKDYTRALSDVRVAVVRDPDYGPAWETQGEILEAMGRQQEAVASYETALARDSSLQEAQKGLARLQAKEPPSARTADDQRSPRSAVDPRSKEAERTSEEARRAPDVARAPRDFTPEQQANRAKLAALQGAYNTLGLDILSELIKAPKAAPNVVISSYSIGSAMAMTLHGASGETEREMRSVLRHSLPRRELGETNTLTLAMLRQSAAGSGGGPNTFQISIANGLALGPNGGRISTEYRSDLTVMFGAQVLPDANLDSINAWVRDRTAGRINAILDRLDPQFSLVLLNAITMKARWRAPFDPQATRDAPFTLASDVSVPVKTMRSEADYAVTERGGLRAIRLPYANGAVAMQIIIADKAERFAGRELGIGVGDLDALLSALTQAKPQRVELTMPKLRISSQADLVAPFRQLGMRRAFDRSAEFDRMLNEPGGALLIDQIQHRVEIDVDEAGTEASAATAVVGAPGAGRVNRDKEIVRFHVDRPFLFLITDIASGAVLFVGRVTDPRSERQAAQDPVKASEAASRLAGCHRAKTHDEAVRNCTLLIERGDLGRADRASALKIRSLALVNLSKPEDAIADAEQAMRMQPSDHRAYYLRALAYFTMGRFERVIADTSQAIELAGSDSSVADRLMGLHIAHNLRGTVHLKQGRIDQAIADFWQAIQHNVNDAGPIGNLATAYLQKGEADEALRFYEMAMKINANDPALYFNRGRAFEMKGDRASAIDDYRRALRLRPDHPESRAALRHLGAVP